MVVPVPEHKDTLSPSAELYGQRRRLCDPGSDPEERERQDGGASGVWGPGPASLAGKERATRIRRPNRDSYHYV